MLIGVVEALLAALAYGSATIFQAIGVRHLAATPEGASLVRRVLAGRMYAVGLAIDAAGFVLAFLALRRTPLFLVESATASSVAITAVLAVIFLGTRLRPREIAALVVVGLGLIALAASAHEGPPSRVGMRGEWWTLGACAPLLALTASAYADRNRTRSSQLLAGCCGLGYGVLGIGARIVPIPHDWWRLMMHPAAWAVVVGGAVATTCYGFALDRGEATTVTAITFSIETIVPAAVGLAWLGDQVRHGLWPLAALGFVLTLGGCLALAGQAEPDSTAAH